MTAARVYPTDTISMQETLDQMDADGYDFMQVIYLGGSRHLVFGIPRVDLVLDEEPPGPRADWSPIDGSG